MISYREVDFVKKFMHEARENTCELPFYKGGPAVDYTDALHAYALNATLLFDPERTPDELRRDGPGEGAEILLVERASGHGEIGSFSGVTGYIDTLTHPIGEDDFDPISHTLQEEFETECGFTNEHFDMVNFYAGTPTIEPRTLNPNARITVVHILGLCYERPEITINTDELASYKWIGLTAIKATERLAKGYRDISLPAALGAIGIRGDALSRILS